MVKLELHFGKKDSRFIHDYIKAGWAETEQETIRHALLMFFWNPPRIHPNKQPGEMNAREMRKKMARFCEAIVAAYRVICTKKGLLDGAKG